MRKSIPAMLMVATLIGMVSRARADSVTYLSDDFSKMEQVIGDIKEETYKQIVIEVLEDGKKVKKIIAPNHVLVISHSSVPPARFVGLSKERDGDYKGAIDKLLECVKDPQAPAWAKWYSIYDMGRIRFKLADLEGDNSYYEKAIDNYQILVKEFPNCLYAPDAWVGIGQALTCLGKLAEARKQLEEALSKEKAYPEINTLRARVGLARILVLDAAKLPKKDRMAKLQEASTSASAIVDLVAKTTDPNLREFRYEALLVKAEALLELGVYDVQNRRDAEAICQDIVNGSNRVDLKAYASNFRGDSLRKRGLTREAYFSYLKTVTLYFQEKHAYQQALYWAAICAARDNQPHKAEEHLRDLKFHYPKSEWLTKLRKDLPGAIEEGKLRAR